MEKSIRKQIEEHLKTLQQFQDSLFEQGHTFWYCDSQDSEHKKPFYYYQINRSEDMATCSTCYKLMENRKKIRSLEKLLGIEQTPLWTNYKQEEHVKRMSVRNSSEWNPNYQYI